MSQETACDEQVGPYPFTDRQENEIHCFIIRYSSILLFEFL